MTTLLTVTQASALSKARGRAVSAATIKHACADGSLPAVKVGKTWAFTSADFYEWLNTPRPKVGNPNWRKQTSETETV